jgi:outer membrane protein W
MFKKFVCFFTIVFFSLAVPVLSQDVTPAMGANAKAMLFSFSGLSTLGANSYEGGIGFKFFLTDPIALRAALIFSGANQIIPANPPAGLAGNDGGIFATKFGFACAVEYHLLQSRVSPYIGAGLGLNYTYTESKTATTGNPPPEPVITKNRIAGETIGGLAYAGGTNFNIGLLGGVEFFIIKELSLSAEYQLGCGLTARSDQEVVSGNTTTRTKVGMLTQFGISSTGTLTLAVYF